MNVEGFFAPLALRRAGVAVSGGVDSTALLIALAEWKQRGFEICALHVNHQLRGTDSDHDEEFVRTQCDTLDIRLHVWRVSVDAARVRETGIENAAREARRAVLLQAVDELELDAIATAHHMNDQAESVLLAILRGGGARRLAGIRAVDLPWIRPLLDVRRDEIEQFLEERNVSPRLDETNTETRFLRNRIRHDVLPLLRTLQPRVIDHLGEIARQLAEGEREIGKREVEWRRKWVKNEHGTVRLAAAGLEESPYLFRRVLLDAAFGIDPGAREISAADLRRITDHFTVSTSAVQVTKRLMLVREGDELILRPHGSGNTSQSIDLPVTADSEVAWPPLAGSRVVITSRAAKGERFETPGGAGELRLRTRRAGDRWWPPGASSTKKLKDVFIERKIERTLRDRLPVLTWNDQIVWVARLGVSKPFLPREAATRVFAVQVLESD